MGKIVHNSYDKLVKNTLHNIERAKEFLAAHLPEKIKQYETIAKSHGIFWGTFF